METYYICAGLDSAKDPNWIRNFDPVLWCNDISNAKRYRYATDAQFDITLCTGTFLDVFEHSAIRSIAIYEVQKDQEPVLVSEPLIKGGE